MPSSGQASAARQRFVRGNSKSAELRSAGQVRTPAPTQADELSGKHFRPARQPPTTPPCSRSFATASQLSVTARELLNLVGQARAFVASRGLKKGDRCALLAHNGIQWVALDLALMAEGVIVVPLYARQAAAELVAMMKDCSPALICCGDAALRDGILQEWPAGASTISVRRDIFPCRRKRQRKPEARRVGSGHHHLYVRYIGRGQGRHADRGQRRPHAGLHLGTPGSADGEQARTRPRVPLSAILFCRLMDHAADVPSAAQAC